MDKGELVANLLQMIKVVDDLNRSADTIDNAYSDVKVQMSHLREDRYDSPAASEFRQSFVLQSAQLTSVSSLLRRFALDLEEARLNIQDAAKTKMGLYTMQDWDNFLNEEQRKLDLQSEFLEFRNSRQDYENPVVGYPRGGFEKWLAEQAGAYNSYVTELEAEQLDKLNLFDKKTFKDIHDEAFEVEKKVFGDHSNNDGTADAFRHAYWSARLTQSFGADWAQDFTNAHETQAGNPSARDFMDRYNNALGIRIAEQYENASPEEIKNLIASAIRDGQGVYIPDSNPGVNTPEQLNLMENGPLAFTNQDAAANNIPIDENGFPKEVEDDSGSFL